MNYWILFEQLLVLLAMMATGYIAYSVKIIDDKGYSQLSSLVVRILNPFLMISGVLGKRIAFSSAEIGQNINFVLALYSILFLLGFVYVRLIRCIDNRSYLLRMLILLPNVGFMGIPLVKEILGAEYIVLVAFYILGFNLIAYTYGIHLSAKYGGKNAKFSLKTLFNPGVICAVLAIFIFAYHIVLPSPVASFINYLGESCIVLSMIVVGAFLAKTDLKQVFFKKQ
ncbi:MAG: AEC family transporter, partial [Candidatus Riflebacteria bacterium]|nr:AEC family transporter [Candidatus Riflebacteria bacterium]